jgi:tRNA(Ile)-lysidine synthase
MAVAYTSNRRTAAFERRVRDALDTHVARSEPVVVACSAGPDSTAALIAVARTRGPADGAVIAANFDHGMRSRAETSADRDAVLAAAATLRIDCLAGEISGVLAPTSEAAAREARYRWLAEACHSAGARTCVTGHTLDDQSETVLMRLTRGTGLGGATGMADRTPWPVDCGADDLDVVRPLLGVRRLEVLSYLEALGVQPRFDATNELVTFDRNRIRHRVLPELRAINPRVDEAVTHFASLARRDDEALEAWAARELGAILTHEPDALTLRRAALRALPAAVASRVLRLAAASLGLQLERSHIETMLRLIHRRGARISLAGGTVAVEDEQVTIRRAAQG